MMRRLALLAFALFNVSAFANGHDFTSPSFGAARDVRNFTGPVTNGSSFLTIWSDDTFNAGWHTHATLADADGTVLKSEPIYAYGSGIMQVFAAGGEYLLFVNSPTGDWLPTSIPFRVVDLKHSATVLAWNGNVFLAMRYDGSTSATGEILDRNGQVLRSGIPLPGFTVSAAALGNDFVVASNVGHPQIERINSSGDVVPGSVLDLDSASGSAPAISVASAGDRVMMAWSAIAGTTTEIHTALLTSSGLSARQTLSTAGQSTTQAVQVAWTGTGFFIDATVATVNYTQDDRHTGLAWRADREGVLIDSQPSIFGDSPGTAFTNLPLFAAVNDRVLFATRDAVTATTFPIGNPSAVRTESVASMLRRQATPSLASDGVDFMAGWIDDSAESASMTVGRMTRSGAALDREGIDVMRVPGAVMGQQSIAFGGGMYLAVWNHYRQIWAQRIRPDGTLIDAQPILVLNEAGFSQQPYVHWNGDAFVVMWMGSGGFVTYTVSAEGVVSGPVTAPIPRVIASGYSFQSTLGWQVTSTGRGFLLVVTLAGYNPSVQPCGCGYGPSSLYAIRLSPSGAAIDEKPVLLTRGDTASLASDGSNALLTFTIGNEVWTAPFQLDTALTMGDSNRILRWMSTPQTETAWNGREYIVAVRANISKRVSYLTAFSIDPRGRVERVAADAAGPHQDYTAFPRIASNAAGQTLIAISEASSPAENERVRGYFFDEMKPARPFPQVQIHPDAVRIGNQVALTWNDVSEGGGDVLFRNGGVDPVVVPPGVHSLTFFQQGPITLTVFNESGAQDAIAITPHAPPLRGRAVRK